MALRLIQLRLRSEHSAEAEPVEADLLDELELLATWEHRDEGGCTTHLLVESEDADDVVNALSERYSERPGFRLVLMAVEATLPAPEGFEDDAEDGSAEGSGEGSGEGSAEGSEAEAKGPPINIEELIASVTDGLKDLPMFSATVALAAIVACVGVYRDSPALVIGSMILAPLLGSNMALCLGTTLGDLALLRRAALVNALGFGIALAISIAFGLLIGVDEDSAQLTSRTSLGALEFVVAAAAGAAGALSVTSGRVSGFVGVMVAIALLPPLVILGMLLGAGRWELALQAGYLTAANVICINLTGSLVLWAQRIRPRQAFDQERAQRAMITGVSLWVGLLAALVALLVFAG